MFPPGHVSTRSCFQVVACKAAGARRAVSAVCGQYQHQLFRSHNTHIHTCQRLLVSMVPIAMHAMKSCAVSSVPAYVASV